MTGLDNSIIFDNKPLVINLSWQSSCRWILDRCDHRMGLPRRGNSGAMVCHGLFDGGQLVLVVTSGLRRISLRMWREFVFPGLGYEFAVSYQDADLHTGATYRFDGWKVLGTSRSGTDTRSGRKGRNKRVWIWPGLPKN